MVQVLVDKRDLNFVIWEQMNTEEVINKDTYAGFNRKICEMMITEARKLAFKEVLPTLQDGDRKGVVFEDDEVTVPKGLGDE